MRGLRSEDASLPVAMLAIMAIGSLVTVLVGTVVIGQRQTRFDQGFEQSLTVAETGLERMVHLIRSKQRTDDFELAEVEVAGGRYRGVAERVPAGSGAPPELRDWLLTATGTAHDGTSRTISLTVEMRSLFGVAAYGRTQVGLRGSNTADSYHSGRDSSICENGGAADPFATSDSSGTRMCSPTGNGVVATNEEMFLRGGVIHEVDRAEIHYAREVVAEPLPGATGFCGGVTETCLSPKLAYFTEPIELEPDPVMPPGDLTNLGSFSGTTLPAGRQLYTNVTLDSGTVVEGTPGNPTILYLTGTLTIPNHTVVNFQSIGGRQVPRPPGGLLIFSAGVGPALRFGNHASFAGAVYAPRATFSGGAAGNIYGSIVAGSISTQGSWNFHYDDALGEVETEALNRTSGWTELFRTTTTT